LFDNTTCTGTSSSTPNSGVETLNGTKTTTSGKKVDKLVGKNDTGYEYKDLVFIDGGTLYFGIYTATDSEGYPNDVDMTLAFHKQ
jgi:hypothetical protein